MEFFCSRLQMPSLKASFYRITHKTGIVRHICLLGAMPHASHCPKACFLCAHAFLRIQLVQKRAYSVRDGDGQNYVKESFFLPLCCPVSEHQNAEY